MSDENQPSIELSDSNIEQIAPSVTLKVHGVPEKKIQSIHNFFPFEFKQDATAEQWEIKTVNQDFGTHKIQTIRLLAVALLIHSQFPKAEMVLMGNVDLKPSSPLTISEAGQIFLRQAGFNLTVDRTDRALNESEMSELIEQFYHFQNQQPSRRGA